MQPKASTLLARVLGGEYTIVTKGGVMFASEMSNKRLTKFLLIGFGPVTDAVREAFRKEQIELWDSAEPDKHESIDSLVQHIVMHVGMPTHVKNTVSRLPKSATCQVHIVQGIKALSLYLPQFVAREVIRLLTPTPTRPPLPAGITLVRKR